MTIDDAMLNFSLEDFRMALNAPRAFAIAMAAHLGLVSAATFGLIHLLQVGPSIVLGKILVGCCPPGNISQVLTYRVRGNVALSVSLTAVTNVVYIVVLPINFSSWGGWHPTASANGAGVVT